MPGSAFRVHSSGSQSGLCLNYCFVALNHARTSYVEEITKGLSQIVKWSTIYLIFIFHKLFEATR